MKKSKRILSMLMTCCFVLTTLPIPVLAVDDEVIADTSSASEDTNSEFEQDTGNNEKEISATTENPDDTEVLKNGSPSDDAKEPEDGSSSDDTKELEYAPYSDDTGSETPLDAEGDITGICGENLTWTLANGTLTISGTGDMDNGNPEKSYFEDCRKSYGWYEHRGEITSVVIESGVTSVGNYAFCEYENLASVSIPSGVTKIGSSSFRDCHSLSGVTIPGSNVS